MKIPIKFLLIVTVCLFYCTCTMAGITVTRYTIENVLSHNTVWCILQDSRGYMWFGTKDGLNRFDGQTSKVYRCEDFIPNNPGSNSINSLYEHKGYNVLWVGTNNGVYLLNTKSNKLSKFNVRTSKGIQIQGAIKSIIADKKGNIWMTAFGLGIFKYDVHKNTLTFYRKAQNSADHSPQTIMTSHPWALCSNHRGEIWASTYRGGVCVYNPKADRFDFKKIDYGDSKSTNANYCFFDDAQNDCMWVGTTVDGLIKYDYKDRKWSRYINSDQSIRIENIHTLADYKTNEILVGADNGLYIFNKITLKFRRLDVSHTSAGDFDKSVYAVLQDVEGGYWAGTYYDGVIYIRPHFESLELFFPPASIGRNINCIENSGSGNYLWIGTNDAGICQFNPETKKFSSYNYLPEGANAKNICEIGNEIWVGTYMKGLFRIGTKSRKVIKNYRNTKADPASVSHNSIHHIFRTSTGTIYVGTQFGLDIYNPSGDNFIHVSQLRNFCIYDIAEDYLGQIWIATNENGVYCYIPQQKTWKNYRYHPATKGSIPSNQIVVIHADRKKRLWFGTERNGICQFDYNTRKFTTYDHKNGLPSDMVCSIEDDLEGNIWISTYANLSKFNPQTKEIRNYCKAKGSQSNVFNCHSSHFGADGKLYFGGVDGFYMLSPDGFPVNEYIAPAVVSDIQVQYKSFPFESMDKIKFKHNQSTIGFSFVTLSYADPSQNKYAYYLEGFDKQWIYTSSRHHATYTNLSPGKYVFHVKGTNNDGLWNNKDTQIAFTILPPWWMRSWMFLLYFLLIGKISHYGVRASRQNSERNHKSELLKYKIEKDKEIFDLKINFFTNLIHEIRTPLSLIKAPLENVIGSVPENAPEKEDLLIMDRNVERLSQLTRQLLDFRKIEENEFVLNLKKCDLKNIAEDVCFRFRSSFQLKKIKLVTRYPQGPIYTNADSEAITKVISNLLNNALKFARTQVELSLETFDQSILLKVTNDGIMIPEVYQEKIFDPFFQIRDDKEALRKEGTGIGLALVKHIVSKHHGEIKVTSDLDCTTFIIRLPYTHNLEDEANKLDIITENRDDTATSKNIATAEQDMFTPETDKSPNKTPTIRENKSTILIVEDNAELLEFMRNNLSKDYKVLLATNGQEALDKVKSDSLIDLIITDILMPVMDGIELCQNIRSEQLYCHIPIILLTAQTDTRSKSVGLENGADVYIEKPFSMTFIRSQIISLLRNRSQLKDLFSKSPYTPPQTIARNNADLIFLNKVNEVIMENLSDTSNMIDTIAQKLAISRSSFHKKIKAISDMTPNDYIQLIKLKKAAELMGSGKYQISEIAYLVGFNTPSYFSKCFYNQFGVLPRDFLKED